MPRTPRGLAPLRHPSFRLLVAGQLTSNVGDAFYAVALPWYVLADHGGALLLGAVLAAYGIPRTVTLAIGGHAADRFGPWTVMMGADTLRAAAVAGLAVAALSGPAHAYLLVPIAAVVGAGEGMFVPGSLSIVPSLLPDEDLQAGNSLAEGGTQLATLVGPVVGGVVVAFAGAGPAFALDAASFLASAITLVSIRARQSRRAASQPVTGEIPHAPGTEQDSGELAVGALGAIDAEGSRTQSTGDTVTPPEEPRATTLRRLVAGDRALQVILVMVVAANLGSGGMGEVALPALAHGPLHAGASGYGALIAAFAGGALLGVVVAAQARRSRRPALVASGAFLVVAACGAAVPYLGGALGAGAALGAFGLLNSFGNIVILTSLQRSAPPALMGRLMGLIMFAAMGIFPLSVLLAGAFVSRLGPAPWFPLDGALLAFAVLGGLTQGSWRRFGAPDPQAAAPEDDPREAAAGTPG
ncbi:MAG: MFS transporter [Actinomycetota bacterium]|nr:MFS transporter [Actinomycetota bacterium]